MHALKLSALLAAFLFCAQAHAAGSTGASCTGWCQILLRAPRCTRPCCCRRERGRLRRLWAAISTKLAVDSARAREGASGARRALRGSLRGARRGGALSRQCECGGEFSGGRGGRSYGIAGRNCAPERLIAAAAAFARVHVPTLWLYAVNDG